MSIVRLNIATQREEGWSADFCHPRAFCIVRWLHNTSKATEQWVDAGLEKFSKMRGRSRLIPAMSVCDWKTDVLDLA